MKSKLDEVIGMCTATFAACCDVTLPAINKLVREGILPKPDKQGYWTDVKPAFVAWARWNASKLKRGHESIAEVKLDREKEKLRKDRVEADLIEGKAYKVEDSVAVNSSILSTFARRVQSIPQSIAKVCHLQPAEFIEKRARQEMISALAHLEQLPNIPEETKKAARLLLS